jgi:hypothetical protein
MKDRDARGQNKSRKGRRGTDTNQTLWRIAQLSRRRSERELGLFHPLGVLQKVAALVRQTQNAMASLKERQAQGHFQHLGAAARRCRVENEFLCKLTQRARPARCQEKPDIIGLVAYSCRSRCSFRPLGVRMPRGSSLPMLNADGGGYGSR